MVRYDFFLLSKALLRKVSDALSLEDLSLEHLTDSAAKRLRRQQIRSSIEQMRVFVVGNSFFATVLAYQAWNTGINTAVIGWTITMIGFSWWLLFNWQKTYATDGSREDMHKFVDETRINASIWCMGMVLFFPFVSGEGKTILTTIMAGSLALGTVGFSQAPRAAFWYVGIQTLVLTTVPIVYSLISGTGSDAMIGFLALFAGIAIANTVLERGRAQMKAFINHEKVSQKSEVIDLLLKDYEEQSTEWLWQTDLNGKVISGPQQVLDLMNLDVSGNRQPDLIGGIKRSIDPRGTQDLQRVIHAFACRTDFYDVTLPFYDSATDSHRWIMMRGRPQFENGQFSGFRGIFADASTTVEAQRQVEFLADHDPLTGIYNRNVVQRRLTDLAPEKEEIAVFLIDLDGFKQVNDSYGHSIGDKLLRIVAERLGVLIGTKDIVARLGGDEFIILIDLSHRGPDFKPHHFADKILLEMSKPFLIDQYDVVLSSSIGTAHFPTDTKEGTNLLIQADLALYVAKQGGRNQCCAFVDRMQDGLQKRILVTDRLRAAIAADQIKPFYQPQYCARTGILVGFEALARWTDSELGAVGPDIFIPVAEETGLIHKLGEQLLRTACQDAVEWGAVHGNTPPLLSVNLSPVQVTRGDIVSMIKDVLAETQLPPTRLEIEITEGVLINDVAATCDVLRDLSDLGVKVALDDFGTGYSSLSYIRTLPLDRLKIDRSFVADLDDPAARSIVKTVIDLCSALGLSVIAEGVETEENVTVLRDMHCDVLQGYYFSAALPAVKAQELTETNDPVAGQVSKARLKLVANLTRTAP